MASTVISSSMRDVHWSQGSEDMMLSFELSFECTVELAEQLAIEQRVRETRSDVYVDHVDRHRTHTMHDHTPTNNCRQEKRRLNWSDYFATLLEQ